MPRRTTTTFVTFRAPFRLTASHQSVEFDPQEPAQHVAADAIR